MRFNGLPRKPSFQERPVGLLIDSVASRQSVFDVKKPALEQAFSHLFHTFALRKLLQKGNGNPHFRAFLGYPLTKAFFRP